MFPSRPLPPEAPERTGIPWVPMILPIGASFLFAITLHSPLALVLGAIGPLSAWLSWLHAHRREQARYEARLRTHAEEEAEYRAATDSLRQKEIHRALQQLPSVQQWVDDQLWRIPPEGYERVRVGEGWWEPPPGHLLFEEGGIAGMPAAITTEHGVALVAPEGSEDLWRSLALQWWSAAGSSPLRQSSINRSGVLPRDIVGPSRAVWVHHIRDVPDECRIILRCTRAPMATVMVPGEAPRILRLDAVSGPLGARALEKLMQKSRVPDEGAPDFCSRTGLYARFSPDSPWIDLVEQGPHCVVWGATGSGKSVAVRALVQSLAERYPPHRLAVALIDFKGGAGLRPLASLPHTVGAVTDLEMARTNRVRQGLAAEMIHRETLLAGRGVAEWSDVDDGDMIPRLLVVIDEVAWLCTQSPQWLDTLSDVARRGRSLGVHLVLSTQRISGVLPRDVMANVLLRVCGRVSDDSEVIEWMPDISVAHRQAIRGLSTGNVLVQGASLAPSWHTVSQDATTGANLSWPKSSWTVWSEDLPRVVEWVHGVWGLEDRARDRRHEPLRESPLRRGILAVIGDPGMGKTNTAFALGALYSEAIVSPSTPEGLWMCLNSVRNANGPVIIDDAESLLQAAGPEGEAFLIDALQGFSGLVILTMSPRHRLSRALARLAQVTMVLGIADKEERARWGGTASEVPGRLCFDDREVQIVYPAPAPTSWSPSKVVMKWPAIVLTSSPKRWDHCDTVVCGPAHALRAEHVASLHEVPVILDGISHRDARAASMGTLTPPPLDPAEGFAWVWSEGRWVIARTADLLPEPN